MYEQAEVLNAAFASRYGDGRNLTKGDRLNTRTRLAKSLLARQYSHLVNDLRQNAMDHHRKEMREWDLILEDISEASDVSVWVSISLLLDVVDLHPCFSVFAITSSTLFILSYKQ